MTTTKSISNVDRPFTCEVCLDSFPWKDALTNHMSAEHWKDRDGAPFFLCGHCDEDFPTKMELDKHLLVHDDEEGMDLGERTACRYCDGVFERDDMKEHMKVAHDSIKKPFACDLCDRRFSSETILGYHMEVHWKVLPLSCGTCNKRFQNSEELEKHSSTHTDVVHIVNRPYSCQVCSERFLWKDQLEHHALEHSVSGALSSGSGGGAATNAAGESERASFSNELLLFVCGKCKQAFPTKAGLKIHMRFHNKDATINMKRSFHCRLCARGFTKQVNLENHLMDVHTEKHFSCEHCNKLFDTEENLKCHTDCHTERNLFVCGICCESFSCADLLKVHLRAHRSKSYICNICNSRFISESSLKKHIMNHTTVRKRIKLEDTDRKETVPNKRYCLRVNKCFLCEKCDKKFLKIEDLNKHVLSHDDDEEKDEEDTGSRKRCTRATKTNAALRDSKATSDVPPDSKATSDAPENSKATSNAAPDDSEATTNVVPHDSKARSDVAPHDAEATPKLVPHDSKATSDVAPHDSKTASNDCVSLEIQPLQCKKCLKRFKYSLSYIKHLAMHRKKK